MSAEQRREEYLKKKNKKKRYPQKRSLKKNKINHINELLHFNGPFWEGGSYSLLLFSFVEALDVNYYGIDRPRKWLREELIPES